MIYSYHTRPKTFSLLCAFVLLALLLNSLAAPVSFSPAGSRLFRLQHKFGAVNPYSSRNFNESNLSNLDRLHRLRSNDRLRHNRFLLGAEVYALAGDLLQTGLYFTEIQIGTPPSTYYVQVDTGSDLTWLNCGSCTTCPTSSDLGVELNLYDPQASSTSLTVDCGDSLCPTLQCLSGPCGYSLVYGDGSSSQGYYVQDTFQLEDVSQSASVEHATVIVGCGTSQGGDLQNAAQALDGILGLGQSSISVISQLAAQNQTPAMFAHCLDGQGNGGGILVLGQVQAEGFVYTPIVPSQPHYNVNLRSLTVNNAAIPIDSASSSETIIDSGTTLAYFKDDVYQLLVTSILSELPQDTQGFVWQGMTCLLFSGSVDDGFPSVTLTFEGTAASMVVKPHDYLIQVQSAQVDGWCIGFQNLSQDSQYFAILGDLLLQDRLVVYDLDQQRIGWADYNCASNVTVVDSTGTIQHVASPPAPSTSHANIVKSFNDRLLHTIVWSLLLIYVKGL